MGAALIYRVSFLGFRGAGILVPERDRDERDLCFELGFLNTTWLVGYLLTIRFHRG